MKRKTWIAISCVIALIAAMGMTLRFSDLLKATAETTATTVGASVTSDQSQASDASILGTLVAARESNGIKVLGASVDPKDPTSVTVKVPASSLTGAKAILTSHELHRQPAILRKDGITFHLLTILSVNDGGEEEIYTMANIDDLVPSEETAAVSPASEGVTKASVESFVADQAQKAGLDSAEVSWADSDTLDATLEVVVPAKGDGTLGAFLDEFNARMTSMHQKGAGVNQLVIRVLDPAGNQLALELQDFDLAQGWRSFWISPVVDKPGDRPEFAPDRNQ
ncbi:MAG: hypothetical protein GXX83_11425 [Gaiellales bacterium]|nr:hypothetical protein [Gaiellales bacterium]